MNLTGHDPSAAATAETPLRAELARAQRALAAIPPVLSHLVANQTNAVFSEEIIARTRGQVESLALFLVRSVGRAADQAQARALAGHLAEQPGLLGYCHALALEAQLAERLARNAGMDPVLSPLVQDCIAADDPDMASTAMRLLASQSRFIQAQRRMELAPDDLPADLLPDVLLAFCLVCGAGAEAVAENLRQTFDEARSRVALLARVALGAGLSAAMTLDRGGISLFLSAVTLATGQSREAVILATSDGQQSRLALLLAVAGLSGGQVEATLMRLHPDIAIPRALIGLPQEQALALLAGDAL